MQKLFTLAGTRDTQKRTPFRLFDQFETISIIFFADLISDSSFSCIRMLSFSNPEKKAANRKEKFITWISLVFIALHMSFANGPLEKKILIQNMDFVSSGRENLHNKISNTQNRINHTSSSFFRFVCAIRRSTRFIYKVLFIWTSGIFLLLIGMERCRKNSMTLTHANKLNVEIAIKNSGKNMQEKTIGFSPGK